MSVSCYGTYISWFLDRKRPGTTFTWNNSAPPDCNVEYRGRDDTRGLLRSYDFVPREDRERNDNTQVLKYMGLTAKDEFHNYSLEVSTVVQSLVPLRSFKLTVE